MRTIWRVLSFVVGAGVLVALLKLFGWDPFAVIEWVFSSIWHGIVWVADELVNSQWFRSIVTFFGK